jgi:hypothetical protein
MNRARHDSIASEVARRILRGPSKKLWSFRDFSDLDSMPVAAALSRLSRAGKLRRVRRGIYYRPKVTAFGESRPDPATVADAVLRRRKSIPLSGYNRLGLTTQVSNDMVRAVERPTRIKPVRGIVMRTVTRPISRQKGITADERLALDALRNIHRIPDASTPSAVKRIKTLVANNRLNMVRLARFARAEPPRVRALLGAIAEDVGNHGSTAEILRQNLNPLTTYRVPGISAALKNASNWHIK